MKTHEIELSNHLTEQLESRVKCTSKTSSYLVARALEEMLGIKHFPVTRQAQNDPRTRK